jgi:hypothetical protein
MNGSFNVSQVIWAGVKVPDEMFFATINHNPSLNVPGSYKGKYQNDMSLTTLYVN